MTECQDASPTLATTSTRALRFSVSCTSYIIKCEINPVTVCRPFGCPVFLIVNRGLARVRQREQLWSYRGEFAELSHHVQSKTYCRYIEHADKRKRESLPREKRNEAACLLRKNADLSFSLMELLPTCVWLRRALALTVTTYSLSAGSDSGTPLLSNFWLYFLRLCHCISACFSYIYCISACFR